MSPLPASSSAAPDTPPAGSRQRRKEARPQELLDAALELFVEKGFAATRSEEVAARAGVSKGTLYLYFPSKEELFKAVVRQNLTTLIAEGQELVGSFEGSTAELLTCLMHEWWTRVVNTTASGIFKIMMSEARNFPDLAQFYVDEVVLPSRQLIGSTIERGIARGEFRALPVDDIVHALIAPVLFMAMYKHSLVPCQLRGIELDPQSFMATQMELILRGLQARDGAGP
ncbi:MAG: TetR/AcrR family transcriptional regulator [Pseudomonadota bacterium]